MNSLINNNSINFLDWGKSNALLLILLFLCVAVGINFPNFFTASNWSLILQSSVLAGIMAIGLSFVMISGGFDLSFAATLLFTGSVAARLMMGDNPNPYFAASAFEGQNTFNSGRGPREIQFRYLPSECTIRIYSIAGELVKTIPHSSPLESGTGRWDLLTEDNLSAAYGMYIYHVDAPNIGEKIGKLAIVK